MSHQNLNTDLLNEGISMSFKAAIDRYDLGHFPEYILEKYENELVYVFENEVSTAIWREILKRKHLTKLAKVSQFGEEVLNIEQGRKKLKVYPDAK